MGLKRFKLRDLEITTTQLLRIALWAVQLYSILSSDKENDSKIDSQLIFPSIMNSFFILFFLHSLFKQILFSCRSMQNLEMELEHSKKNLKFFEERSFEPRLNYIEAVKNNPKAWIYKYASNKVLITPEEDRVYSDVNKWHKLLAKFKSMDPGLYKKMFSYLPEVKENLPHKSLYQQYLSPYGWSRDCISKFRMLDQLAGIYSAGILYLLLSNFQAFPDAPSNKEYIAIGSAFVFFILACRENYLLKDQEFILNLHGIQTRVTRYYDFPPTCIGQQLTSKRLFVGDNQALRDSVFFLGAMAKVVDQYSSIKPQLLISVWLEMVKLRKAMGSYFNCSDEVNPAEEVSDDENTALLSDQKTRYS